MGRPGHPEAEWQRILEGNSRPASVLIWLCLYLSDMLLLFQALFIRMSKHPSCFRLTGDVLSDWTEGEGRRVLFRGSVAELCPLAPNNVNTMAAAAVAAGTLGFTGVQGEIVSDTAWVSHWPEAAFHICSNHTPSHLLCASGYVTIMWWRWRRPGPMASQYTQWGGTQPNWVL